MPAIPRYFQAKTRLLDLVNELPDNTPFPPERELSDVFGMSRTTIRKAMDELVLEGRLVRGAGRQGTAVAPRKQVHRIGLDALVQDLAAREQVVVRTIGAQDVINVESVLVRGDEPVGVRSTYLRASRFPRFAERYDGTTPLRRFLSDAYGMRFGELCPWCTTALATPRVAGLLDVRPATPVLSVAWLGHDLRGTPVERSWVVLRGDRAHLTMQDLSAPARP
ncbi:GntR family transcriptional regulator [Lentzea albidocapillata subsp. violacea]|uniref:GntR family transcriptional regulator n=1 Tax=Lentzea albidocapillata subsp. violacea TaxID=128104 RepID=A0A1G9TSQ6_9PSEU|nr:GntR family transcriptional regulator [Lentzea albidocapillata]SDM50474.1 GntR family transcriptional regulator [Lentzea albidocapillata subsp. violacea]